ncbi:MAG TPA: hypothetical protein PLU72_19375 [Candidatus Ozemobacteraceae bacterium]|nr:hypothetical protein [Candidatus Ozemobacteraceae bacterium]HQG29440.1 hypothetical protein [Candidatus Ozemobacteraceae bacterium]
MFKLEFSEEDLALLKSMLSREIADTRVEIHHCRNMSQFQDALKAREAELHSLLDKVMRLLPT